MEEKAEGERRRRMNKRSRGGRGKVEEVSSTMEGKRNFTQL